MISEGYYYTIPFMLGLPALHFAEAAADELMMDSRDPLAKIPVSKVPSHFNHWLLINIP
jgi:hypothetical protein